MSSPFALRKENASSSVIFKERVATAAINQVIAQKIILIFANKGVYKVTKNMSIEEKIAYYNTAGRETEEEIQKRKALKRKDVINVYR